MLGNQKGRCFWSIALFDDARTRFNGFDGFNGKGGGFAASIYGAMPEGLRRAGFPFMVSATIRFTANDKDPSAALGMTIREGGSLTSDV